MEKHPLHVTNGSVLTNRLNELNVEGDIITWQEMLCEGPTVEQVYSEEFSKISEVYKPFATKQDSSQIQKINSYKFHSYRGRVYFIEHAWNRFLSNGY